MLQCLARETKIYATAVVVAVAALSACTSAKPDPETFTETDTLSTGAEVAPAESQITQEKTTESNTYGDSFASNPEYKPWEDRPAATPPTPSPDSLAFDSGSAPPANPDFSAPSAKPSKAVKASAKKSKKSRLVLVSASVRAKPNAKSKVLRTLHKGDKIRVVSVKGSWAKIGKGQYVRANQLKSL